MLVACGGGATAGESTETSPVRYGYSVHDSVVDTGGFLGHLHVEFAPSVYSYRLGNWIHLPNPDRAIRDLHGVWIYVRNAESPAGDSEHANGTVRYGYPAAEDEVETGAFLGRLYVGAAPWVFSYRLKNWIFLGDPEQDLSRSHGSWAYLLNAPLRVTGVTVAELGHDTVRVSWTTNRAASSRVEYGPAGTALSHAAAKEESGEVEHSMEIVGLTPETAYDFRVVSSDAHGQSVASPVDRFTTAPASAAPREFVVFQGTRRFVAGDNGFHYYFQQGQPLPTTWPSSWREPVDYWSGTWYIRVELLSTPKGLPITFQPCIWMHDVDGASSIADELESCGQPYLALSAPGVYTVQTGAVSTWWHKDGGNKRIDITRPHHFKRLGLVLRTAQGCYITPYNVSPNCWHLRDDYVPMEFHLTIVAVAGRTRFSGWENYVPQSGAAGAESGR